LPFIISIYYDARSSECQTVAGILIGGTTGIRRSSRSAELLLCIYVRHNLPKYRNNKVSLKESEY